MVTKTYYPAGTFCAPGLCSGNADTARAFYTGLFGWNAEDIKTPVGSYTVFQLDGHMVAGVYQMANDRKQAGVKPHWNSYLACDDVVKATAKCRELGGKVHMEPTNMGGDIMANLEDPTGARFSVWQTGKDSNSGKFGEPGSLCWGELYTPDTSVAGEFYHQLFGWKLQPFDGEIEYTIFQLEENDCGVGGMARNDIGGEPMPPQWLPYFMVTDAEATVAKAKELGSKNCHGVMEVPQVGQIAIMADPEHALFAVIQPIMLN